MSPKSIFANVTTPKTIIVQVCLTPDGSDTQNGTITGTKHTKLFLDLGIRITNSVTVAKAPALAADPWVRSPAHTSREKQSFAMEFAVWANQNGERRQKLAVSGVTN